MSPRDFERPGRSPVMARHGMAATSHPLATLTAVEILKQGGNAMDAAVAACAVQGMVEPESTGIGGDCFALFARADGRVHGFNGSGRAPAAATPDWYASRGITQIERHSPHAVTVPGAVDAWATLIADHGTRSLDELLQQAITLAREGYAVTPRVAFDWARQASILSRDPTAARIFLPDGSPPAAGSVHRQPELAETLAAIARHGRAAFYEGAVAADIVEHLQSLGGLHTMADFASARGGYVTPIKREFRGYEVHECPPGGQGIIALMLLGLLSRLPRGDDPSSPNRLQREIEAARFAYRVRDEALCDPEDGDMAVDWLLSEAFAEQLGGHFDLRQGSGFPNLRPAEHSDTVYISVVDRDRMAVSFINSIFHNFGSGIVSPRSGVLLQNRGQGFVLDGRHSNAIGPGKRPMHTIIPGMLTRGDRVVMPFGVMGGHYQAMGHAHLLTRIIDFGLDPQAALDLPRLFPIPGSSAVEVEGSFPQGTLDELERRGFDIVRAQTPIGGGQAVWIDWEQGVLVGASDPRKDGCALGY